MARKRPSISRPMLFTWLMLGSLIFFLAPKNITSKFHFAFVRLFRPFLSAGRGISLSALSNSGLGTEAVSRREYDKLRNYAANLEVELHQEHQKVEQLSGLRNRFALDNAAFVIADVITVSANGLRLDVNRGRTDGLAKGQFVLSDNSIIGVISDISSTSAKVRLITDLSQKLHVKTATSDVYIHGLMQGDGKRATKIRNIQTIYRINRGDYVYACKVPDLLDKPIIVGTVAQCEVDDANPLLWDITVEPACDIERLKSVAVVVMNPQDTD